MWGNGEGAWSYLEAEVTVSMDCLDFVKRHGMICMGPSRMDPCKVYRAIADDDLKVMYKCLTNAMDMVREKDRTGPTHEKLMANWSLFTDILKKTCAKVSDMQERKNEGFVKINVGYAHVLVPLEATRITEEDRMKNKWKTWKSKERGLVCALKRHREDEPEKLSEDEKGGE